MSIALAKLRKGTYIGRKRCLNPAQAKELRLRVADGESKTAVAGDLGISRQTLYIDTLQEQRSEADRIG